MQHLAANPSALPTDASALDSSISALKSSISVLESSLKTVGQSSGRWETVAWVCSIVVALGVAAEIIGIVWEYRDDLRDWRRGIIRPPDRPSSKKLWFEIAATLLVVAGIFGEAGASLELASINSQLRSITSELRAKSDQLLALVTQVAGDAATNAQRAKDRADEVGGTADNLRRQLAAEVTVELAARHREAELEKSIAPRVLPIDLDDVSLKPFAGTHFVLEVLPEFEAIRAANHIKRLVGGAGWFIDKTDRNPQLDAEAFDGVTISDSSTKTDLAQAGKASAALTMWLKCHGWEARLSGVPIPISKGLNNKSITLASADDVVRIAVGFKPDTFFVMPGTPVYPISDLARSEKCPAKP